MSLRIAVFDFDQTLAALPVDWDSMRARLHAHFRNNWQRDVDFSTLSEGLYQVRRELGEKALASAYEIAEECESEAIDRLVPLNETLDAVRYIHDLGAALAVFSNNMGTSVRQSLDVLAIRHIVSMVVGREAVRQYKPNPDGLNMILDSLRASPDEAVFVGDSHLDERAAELAGVRFVPVDSLATLRGLPWSPRATA